MDIGKSLQYAFEDERWLSKLGLGALISLIPILNFAWVGFYIDVMRNVSDGVEPPMPEWVELGEKFVKGLLVTVAAFIYALPGVLFLCLPIGVLIVPAFIQDTDAQSTLAVFTTLGGTTLMCCIGLYFLLFSFIYPAVQLRFSRMGTFQSCFQIREIFSLISSNLGDYLVAWLITLAAGFVVGLVITGVGLVLGWIPCLGQVLIWVASAIAGAWVSVVYAHIFGQLGAKVIAPADLVTKPLE
jgi:hypothetical protein